MSIIMLVDFFYLLLHLNSPTVKVLNFPQFNNICNILNHLENTVLEEEEEEAEPNTPRAVSSTGVLVTRPSSLLLPVSSFVGSFVFALRLPATRTDLRNQ